MTRLYLIAGETSGDVLGARLITALRARRPDLDLAGIGGPRMAALGLRSLFPMDDLAVMGFLEVLPRLALLRRRLAETIADIARRRPEVVVTIDSPGFTLRVLRAIAPLGLRRVHYVAPQVWAWREGRVRRYPGLWDDLLCLLPFEPAFFARYKLPATFVGHPVLQSGAERGDGPGFRRRYAIPDTARVLTLMPGSRHFEVRRLLPVYAATLAHLPNVVPVMPAAPAVAAAVREAVRGWAVPPILVDDEGEKHDAFAASAAALTKSGTSTLELALAGVPMLVAYRANPLSAAIARRLVTIRYAALVNLLADADGPPLVPEFLQQDCTPGRLVAALRGLLDDPAQAAAQRAGFARVVESLRPADGLAPSEAAANAVLALLEQA
ncbi:MAG TPA: lipid-A-disaccharide synthase [Acetobacteraceae bacterium]|nr:lipid-A-disaccharide synthase [Acetobacteraceae bacterium]